MYVRLGYGSSRLKVLPQALLSVLRRCILASGTRKVPQELALLTASFVKPISMAQSRLLRPLQTVWQHCSNRLAVEPFAAAAPQMNAWMSTWRPAGAATSTSSQASWQAPRHIPLPGQPAFHGQRLHQQHQQRAYRCCPGLDGAPPDIISIEFDPEEVDRYIQVADAIEAAFPGIVVEGNEGGEGAPGSFEIKASSGELIFSKLSSGRWPEVEGLIADMQAGAVCDLPGAATGAGKAAQAGAVA